MSKDKYQDDGHTIIDMNVEGMPWYNDKKTIATNSNEILNSKQTRIALWGSIKAALLISLIFSGAIVLFVLFCLNVWFK